MFTARELWGLAWPEVPFEEASAQDAHLFFDHAESLNLYLETR